MSDEIKSALTREQWANAPRIYFREPRGRDEGFGVELSKDASMLVWDDSWGLTVGPDDRHALAALCLHGQPFGFTEQMAFVCRILGRQREYLALPVNRNKPDSPTVGEVLTRTAELIEALLPPHYVHKPAAEGSPT